MLIDKLLIQKEEGESTRLKDFAIFRHNLLVKIMLIAMIFATLFGGLHDLGINPLNDFHAKVNYIYAFAMLILLFFLHSFQYRYTIILNLYLLASLLTFISAYINVGEDMFRVIWFYLLVLVAFMLGTRMIGVIYTVLSLGAIYAINELTGPLYNEVTMTSILLGLVILSIITYVFTKQATKYASIVEESNYKLKILATEDPLTGIINSRHYYEVCEELFSLAKRNKRPLAILYQDMDNFKLINDQYGHHIGDEVLTSVVNAVNSVLRDSDVYARVGGDEFCVALPDTNIQGAKLLAKKILDVIRNLEIKVNDDVLSLTSSIGISSLESSDKTMKQIQIRADQGLYLSKEKGRNRFEVGVK